METADHNAKELQGLPTAAVNKLNRGAEKIFSTGTRLMTSAMTHKNSRNYCYHWGGKHSANDCRFSQSKYRLSKKVGDNERVYCSKLKQSQRGKGNATSQTYNLSFSSDDPANGSKLEMPDEYSKYHVWTNNRRAKTELYFHFHGTRH